MKNKILSIKEQSTFLNDCLQYMIYTMDGRLESYTAWFYDMVGANYHIVRTIFYEETAS